MGDNEASNGRVTTREFFNALMSLKDVQSHELAETERRLMDKIDNISSKCPALKQIESNTKEIDTLRKRSNILDTVTGLIAIVATGLGFRQ